MDILSNIASTVINVGTQNYRGAFLDTTLISMFIMTLNNSSYTPKTKTSFQKAYDFIIVGGGSAGSVLAARLSEIPCVSILLLEAGSPPFPLTEIPYAARATYGSEIDWNYLTVPQKHCGNALKNKQVVWPMGKTLGGSSTINGMISTRGNKKNYDDWAANGCEGWSFDDVFPYFKKLEDNADPNFLRNGYHGTGGPMTVSQTNYCPEIKCPIAEAAENMGYEFVDPNGARQTGFYDFQATLRDGLRCSTAKAYLVPADNRTNLDIITGARVLKVIIEGNTATGVEFDFQGETHIVQARREVIVSAGTVNTAQILMLSGIGPKKHLEDLGIPVVANLPVGQNLQDHVSARVNFQVNSNITELKFKLMNPLHYLQFLESRSGLLASPSQVTLLAFLKGTEINPKEDFPSVEIAFSECSTIDAYMNFNLDKKVYKKVYYPYEHKPMWTCLVNSLQPRSRGSVSLKSTDPYDKPLIDPNYFDDPEDVKDVVDGMKVCLKIGNSDHMMKTVGSRSFETIFPGCEKFVGDEYLACQAKAETLTIYHPVGTAKMGASDDPTTVVDPKLRVKGIKNLRVVCAAVMPMLPSGNTNVPTIMIAEKASDIIKSAIKCDHKQ